MPTDSQGFITEWKGQQIDGEFITRMYPQRGAFILTSCICQVSSNKSKMAQPCASVFSCLMVITNSSTSPWLVCAALASQARLARRPKHGERRCVYMRSDTEHNSKGPDLSQAKFFTESRLLQRHIRVQLLSLPNASATPFQAGANATAPPPASIFIGTGRFNFFEGQKHHVSATLSCSTPSSRQCRGTSCG